jgi:hypothetical protein
MGNFASQADDAPAHAFDVVLPLCIVFGPSRKIMHCTVDLNRHARFSNGEVSCVPADLVLANDMNSFGSQ